MRALASRMSVMSGEGALTIFAQAKELERSGRSIIHLELGEPDFHPAKSVNDALKRAIDDGKDRYCPVIGVPALREALAAYLRDTRSLNGIEFPHPARHEETLDDAQHCGDPCPEEAAVKDTKTGAPQVEVMDTESAQKQGQQNANYFVTASRFILFIEDRLRVGIRNAAHDRFSLLTLTYTVRPVLQFPSSSPRGCFG